VLTDEEGERIYAAFGTHVPDERKRAASPQNRALYRSGMDVVRRTEILDQLGAVTSPTLVCVGERDPVTPVGAYEEIVAALPAGRARLELIKGAGHFTWLDAPDAFWPVVTEFIRVSDPRTRAFKPWPLRGTPRRSLARPQTH
jgi:pimeloyl-ACP methyl ester carboxylesterase